MLRGCMPFRSPLMRLVDYIDAIRQGLTALSEFHPLDLASAQSIRTLKDFVEQKVASEKVQLLSLLFLLTNRRLVQPEAIVLVNNAGVLKKGWSKEEFDETIASNVAVRCNTLL